MTLSPTHSSLFFSCLPPIHPSPLFFLLPCRRFPTIPEPLPTLSEDPLHQSEARTSVTSSSENWVKRVPCVKLMRFWVLWCHRLLGRRFSTTNQKPPFSEQLSEDFPKIFRRCSPPIRSQEICDVIFVKLGQKGPTVLLKPLGNLHKSEFLR